MSPHVLLVVDDPAFRGPLMLALRDRALRVTLLPDPREARDFLLTSDVSLVIVDGRLMGGESGAAWVHGRRNEGVAAQIVLCAATKDEQQALVRAAASLDVSSVVPKTLAPEVIAAHIDELVTAPPPAAENPDAERLAAALERMRVSIVNLQKNAESLDRILSSLAEAQRLREFAASVGAAVIIASAKQIEHILTETRDGRRRLDGASWTPIERALAKARESISAVAPSALPVRRPSSSAYEAKVDVEPQGPGSRAPDDGLDELTGLPTADAFLREAQERADDASISGRPLSICVLGVDGAAELRAAGRFTPVMQEIGRFLAGRFRPEDLRGRCAVDAFALAFPGTPATMAVATMTRTLDAFAQLGLGVRIGIGVATFPKEGRDAASTLAFATRRMESVRATGGVRGP